MGSHQANTGASSAKRKIADPEDEEMAFKKSRVESPLNNPVGEGATDGDREENDGKQLQDWAAQHQTVDSEDSNAASKADAEAAPIPAEWFYFLDAAKQDAEFVAKAARKGDFLYRAMRANNQEAGALFNPPRSTAQADPEVADCDDPWDEYEVWPSCDNEETAFLQSMTNFGLDVEWENEGGHLRSSHWVLHENEEVQWRTALDPANGIIAALNSVSPRSELGEGAALPLISNWSDAAFTQWRAECSHYEAETGLPASELSNVFQHWIINDDTQALMTEVVQNKCSDLLDESARITVAADSPEGRLLLASPNGAGVAYLLIQHKDQLGHKVVDRISIYPIRNDGDLAFGLLFHIKDVLVEQTVSNAASMA